MIEFLENRESTSNVPVHVINIDIVDNHDEAVKGSFLISDLVSMLAKTSDLDNEIDEVCYNFETENNKNILHSVMFYWTITLCHPKTQQQRLVSGNIMKILFV